MAIEVERKFLIGGELPPGLDNCPREEILQGYLATGPVSVRVRIRRNARGTSAVITVKGPMVNGGRLEFEYPVPVDDAEAMLSLCVGPPIEKTRLRYRHGGHVWEVDVFSGANAPLKLAEVELGDINEALELPNWLGEEVTDDVRYQNAYLAEHPYGNWGS